jgi:hypothetical protein
MTKKWLIIWNGGSIYIILCLDITLELMSVCVSSFHNFPVMSNGNSTQNWMKAAHDLLSYDLDSASSMCVWAQRFNTGFVKNESQSILIKHSFLVLRRIRFLYTHFCCARNGDLVVVRQKRVLRMLIFAKQTISKQPFNVLAYLPRLHCFLLYASSIVHLSLLQISRTGNTWIS